MDVRLIAVVGLAFEARIAAGPGVRVICSGNGKDLAASLSRAISEGATGVMSFGVAGGLSPTLEPGTCIIGSGILFGNDRISRINTDHDWSQKLLQTIPGAVRGLLLGVTEPVIDPRAKAALYMETGAIAVDMESHVVGGVAAAHGIPMAAVRVIADPAARAIPASALAAMRPNGTTDVPAMIWSMLKRPTDFPAVVRTALDARAARATLVRGRRLLEPGLGIHFARRETAPAANTLPVPLPA
ncbi:MAG TPA: phosphorylase [Xanthobacteraceae bacterium]|jgi:hopanoid-associated phosphorylase|nr:phosphorylase [Xanthobacteraceae bacterium]